MIHKCDSSCAFDSPKRQTPPRPFSGYFLPRLQNLYELNSPSLRPPDRFYNYSARLGPYRTSELERNVSFESPTFGPLMSNLDALNQAD